MIRKLRQSRHTDIEKYRFNFLDEKFSYYLHKIYLEGTQSQFSANILSSLFENIKGFDKNEGKKKEMSLKIDIFNKF